MLNQIQLGDTLCVASVKALAVGGVDLFRKMQFLSNKGVDFSSGNERYLNFSVTQPISAVSLETLRNIAQREHEFVELLLKCQINSGLRDQLISRIQWECMTDIVLIFRNKGVMKRGN